MKTKLFTFLVIVLTQSQAMANPAVMDNFTCYSARSMITISYILSSADGFAADDTLLVRVSKTGRPGEWVTVHGQIINQATRPSLQLPIGADGQVFHGPNLFTIKAINSNWKLGFTLHNSRIDNFNYLDRANVEIFDEIGRSVGTESARCVRQSQAR